MKYILSQAAGRSTKPVYDCMVVSAINAHRHLYPATFDRTKLTRLRKIIYHKLRANNYSSQSGGRHQQEGIDAKYDQFNCKVVTKYLKVQRIPMNLFEPEIFGSCIENKLINNNPVEVYLAWRKYYGGHSVLIIGQNKTHYQVVNYFKIEFGDPLFQNRAHRWVCKNIIHKQITYNACFWVHKFNCLFFYKKGT